MATFFVGQRVRAAYPNKNWCDHLKATGNVADGELRTGDEGLVLGTESRPNRGFYNDFGEPVMSVSVDRLGITGLTPCSCWEPILPEGHRAGDFSFSELMDKCRAGEGVPA